MKAVLFNVYVASLVMILSVATKTCAAVDQKSEIVAFSLLLAATVIAEVIFTVEGDIVFSLIPNSVCLPSSAEWEVTGNILLRLFLSGVEKFEKPEGIYGYGWDPSLHFFQPGEDNNAGQDFGLSKRLLGDGTGRYEYEQ